MLTNTLKNYLRQVAKTQEPNKFFLRWGGVCLRNCGENGDLVTFKNVKEFKTSQKRMWIYLPLLLFRENGDLFPIFQCPECPAMDMIEGLSLDQKAQDLMPIRCIHSQAAAYFAAPWDTHWSIERIDDSTESFKVQCDLDFKIQELRSDGLFLAAYQHEGNVSLLFTVSKCQKYPFCSKCSTKRCKCFRKFKMVLEEEADPDESVDFFWKKLKTDRPMPSDHFLEIGSVQDYIVNHGYNLTSFEYPIKRSKELREKFINRLNGEMNMPAKIVPEYNPFITCEQHGNSFSESPDKLVKVSSNSKVFTENSEFILETECYGRPSEGNCKCIFQADTHSNLLWNLGNGKFICYTFLHSAIHKIATGSAMNAIYSSRSTTFSSLGVTTSLTVKDLTKAITGFATMLKFRNEDFKCNNCGDTPDYIVCDGKSIGPAKRKVNHLTELDRAEDDDTPLLQRPKFPDRMFLNRKAERDFVKNLVTEQLSMQEFLRSDINTVNGQMIYNLVSRLARANQDELSEP